MYNINCESLYVRLSRVFGLCHFALKACLGLTPSRTSGSGKNCRSRVPFQGQLHLFLMELYNATVYTKRFPS